MRGFDPTWNQSIADLLINLSAGWYGAIFIIPVATKLTRKINIILLTVNLIIGTLSLVVAVELRKISI